MVSVNQFVPVLILYTVFGSTSAVDYFPRGYFTPSDVTKVTWEHGVNSKEVLDASLRNDIIQMLEADLVMGTLTGSGVNATPIVIMAHPPDNESDLSFDMFLEGVIDHNKELEVSSRKGIKLDFKDFEAAQQAIPIIHEKREADPEQLNFPIWINADILAGPVEASTPKVDGNALIALQQQFSNESTLSIGWTTRFGKTSSGELIKNGKYTKENMDKMVNLIKQQFPDPVGDNVTVEITFPLRAGLAMNSLENIKYLLDESGINFTYPSITLWEGSDDPPLDLNELEEFIKEVKPERVFVDLPYTMNQPSGGTTQHESKVVLTLIALFIGCYMVF